jgi:hypothetical protein
VLDAATGAPVAGATVSVDTTRVATRTDSMGRFQLEQVPLGRQTVSVRALGFQQAQHQLAVQAADSTQLGFALQKAAEPLAAVVTGQAQPVGQESRRRALNLETVAANSASILGCYDLRVIAGARDMDSALAGLPSRIELEARAAARARREEPIVNRARKVAGDGDVESWRFVGDSLELTLLANERTRVLRFARDNARWVSENVVLERCGTRPNE